MSYRLSKWMMPVVALLLIYGTAFAKHDRCGSDRRSCGQVSIARPCHALETKETCEVMSHCFVAACCQPNVWRCARHPIPEEVAPSISAPQSLLPKAQYPSSIYRGDDPLDPYGNGRGKSSIGR